MFVVKELRLLHHHSFVKPSNEKDINYWSLAPSSDHTGFHITAHLNTEWLPSSKIGDCTIIYKSVKKGLLTLKYL